MTQNCSLSLISSFVVCVIYIGPVNVQVMMSYQSNQLQGKVK